VATGTLPVILNRQARSLSYHSVLPSDPNLILVQNFWEQRYAEDSVARWSQGDNSMWLRRVCLSHPNDDSTISSAQAKWLLWTYVGKKVPALTECMSSCRKSAFF
jgi:hypothetical protein